MKPKLVIIFLVSLVIIVFSFYMLARLLGSSSGGSESVGANVTMENGTQVIAISAKGGYTPRQTNATAGLPTVIRVTTSNSYDCSVSLAVPKLRYQRFFQPSETVDIPVTAAQAAGKLSGVCGMGMYSFNINFN